MFALLGQMVRLPFAVMGYLFEMASTTAKGLEQMAGRSWRETQRTYLYPAGDGNGWEENARPQPALPPALVAPSVVPVIQTMATTMPPEIWQTFEPRYGEERTRMPDTNLNDDMVKLVEFSIVSIERESERILKTGQIIVTDDLTGNAFSNARVAEWVCWQDEERESLSEEARRRHHKAKPDTLRVYYNVLDRWPKEDLKRDEKSLRYDEEKIEVLREIARKIGNRPHQEVNP